jgi:hypothetical protein
MKSIEEYRKEIADIISQSSKVYVEAEKSGVILMDGQTISDGLVEDALDRFNRAMPNYIRVREKLQSYAPSDYISVEDLDAMFCDLFGRPPNLRESQSVYQLIHKAVGL